MITNYQEESWVCSVVRGDCKSFVSTWLTYKTTSLRESHRKLRLTYMILSDDFSGDDFLSSRFLRGRVGTDKSVYHNSVKTEAGGDVRISFSVSLEN